MKCGRLPVARWQHAKNASMVKMITIKNSLRLVTSIKVSRMTI